jgi:hypothetical protein
MTNNLSIPHNSPDYDQSRVIERPDGFYWQEQFSGKLYGPFSTLLKAVQDMQGQDDTGYEEGESLEEAQDEIGIADWIDPETGQPAEDLPTHLSDN